MALITVFWTPSSIPPRPSTTPRCTGRSPSLCGSTLGSYPSNLVELVGSVALSTRLHPYGAPDARPAPVRGIRDVIDRPAIVRPRHCRPGGRSPAKTPGVALVGSSTPSQGLGFPSSTATLSRRPWPSSVVDVPMGIAGRPVASSVSAEVTPIVHRAAAHRAVVHRAAVPPPAVG